MVLKSQTAGVQVEELSLSYESRENNIWTTGFCPTRGMLTFRFSSQTASVPLEIADRVVIITGWASICGNPNHCVTNCRLIPICTLIDAGEQRIGVDNR